MSRYIFPQATRLAIRPHQSAEPQRQPPIYPQIIMTESQLYREHKGGRLSLKPWGGDQANSRQFDNAGWQRFDNHGWAATTAFQDPSYEGELSRGTAGPVNFVLSVWDRLKSHNAVCTLSSQPSIYSFAEQCIFFATIEWLPFELPKLFGDDKRGRSAERNQDSIGCIYLSSTHRTSEASIGIVLLPEYTGKGLGPLAIEIVLGLAFDAFQFHRVCAIIPEHPDKATAIQVFQRFGFVHEGTHRLAATSETGNWVDERHYAMVDTDWVFRRSPMGLSTAHVDKEWKLSPWEQLLARQEKEREAMLLRDAKLHRSSSTETLRLSRQVDEDLDYVHEEDEEEEDDEMSSYSSDDESFVSIAEEKGKQNPFAFKGQEIPADPFTSSTSLPQPSGSYEPNQPIGDEELKPVGATAVNIKLEDDDSNASALNLLSGPTLSSPNSAGEAAAPFVTAPNELANNLIPSRSTADHSPINMTPTRPLPHVPTNTSNAARNTSPRWTECRSPRADEFDARSESGSQSSRWDLLDDDMSVRSVSERSGSESLVSASEDDLLDLSDDEDPFLALP